MEHNFLFVQSASDAKGKKKKNTKHTDSLPSNFVHILDWFPTHHWVATSQTHDDKMSSIIFHSPPDLTVNEHVPDKMEMSVTGGFLNQHLTSRDQQIDLHEIDLVAGKRF